MLHLSVGGVSHGDLGHGTSCVTRSTSATSSRAATTSDSTMCGSPSFVVSSRSASKSVCTEFIAIVVVRTLSDTAAKRR